MASTFSEESIENISTIQNVIGFISEQSSLLNIREENEENSIDSSDASIHSNQSSHSSERGRIERPKKLSSHAVAFPLMLLLIIFKQLIDGTKPCTGVYKNLVEYANSFNSVLTENEPFLKDILNTDFGLCTLENVLDKLKKSETYMATMAPILYDHIKALENSDLDRNTNLNITKSKQIANNRKTYKVKFTNAVYFYKYLLNNLKALCESGYLDEMKRGKFYLRIIYEDLKNKSPETYSVVRNKIKKIESQLKNLKKEEKLAAINEEIQFLNVVDEEINNYDKIFQDILFYPFGSSTSNLEDKLEASVEKLKKLVPDFHAFSITD